MGRVSLSKTSGHLARYRSVGYRFYFTVYDFCGRGELIMNLFDEPESRAWFMRRCSGRPIARGRITWKTRV